MVAARVLSSRFGPVLLMILPVFFVLVTAGDIIFLLPPTSA
jgi:hypothetical protein